MSEILQDLSEPALPVAIEGNFFGVALLWRSWPAAEIHDDPDMLWTITDIPFGMFNTVMRAQLTPESADAAIKATIARCGARNVPMAWFTGPVMRPANLPAYLEAHGFTGGDGSCMALDLLAMSEDLPAPRGLMIEHVSDGETLKQWCHAMIAGFGIPEFVEGASLDCFTSVGFGGRLPLRLYLGRLKGGPVATSMLLLGAGVAGIYCVATIPEARRQGIGTAMTLAPLREARALGYRVGILDASDMGFGVYHNIGFREVCRRSQYIWRSAAETNEETADANPPPIGGS